MSDGSLRFANPQGYLTLTVCWAFIPARMSLEAGGILWFPKQIQAYYLSPSREQPAPYHCDQVPVAEFSAVSPATRAAPRLCAVNSNGHGIKGTLTIMCIPCSYLLEGGIRIYFSGSLWRSKQVLLVKPLSKWLPCCVRYMKVSEELKNYSVEAIPPFLNSEVWLPVKLQKPRVLMC